MPVKPLVPLLGLLLVLAGCATAPETGRRQLILVSEDQARQLGAEAYTEIKKEKRVVAGTDEAQMLDRIGRDIAAVVEEPKAYDWEFTLFADETPNAFALPGGKIGFHTGMLDIAESGAQLAAVMAHEVAHVTARHAAERMSRQMVEQLGLRALATAVDSQALVGLMAQAATLGVQLPFSREQEAEADEIGLMYMARAGYDPRAAIDLWQNMKEAGGDRPPQFLSTHPLPESRIERLRRLMPEALEVYRAQQRI